MNRATRALVACPELLVRKLVDKGIEPATLRSTGRNPNHTTICPPLIYLALQLILTGRNSSSNEFLIPHDEWNMNKSEHKRCSNTSQLFKINSTFHDSFVMAFMRITWHYIIDSWFWGKHRNIFLSRSTECFPRRTPGETFSYTHRHAEKVKLLPGLVGGVTAVEVDPGWGGAPHKGGAAINTIGLFFEYLRQYW